MLGILCAIVHGERPLCLRGKLLECPRNRLIGFGSGLTLQFRKPKESGLSLGHAVKRCLAPTGDQRITLPVAELFSLIDCLRPGINGNPVGNFGFSHFSPFALDAPFPMGATELGDELLPIRGIPVIDELVNRLRTD